jgi:hypothetical protein
MNDFMIKLSNINTNRQVNLGMLTTHVNTEQLNNFFNSIPDDPNQHFVFCVYTPWDSDCRKCPLIERCLDRGKVLR